MKVKSKKFIVSCSGWKIEVEANNADSAANVGLAEAFKIFGKKLLLSTTIMVKGLSDFKIHFYCILKVLNEIGFSHIAEGIKIISKSNKLKEFSV